MVLLYETKEILKFLIVWNIVELLAMLKNITKYLKSWHFVQNVAFYSLSALICILLKLQQTSSLVKHLAL